jgi:outer membrane protein OmpA-like peptidoglycan-associated protein
MAHKTTQQSSYSHIVILQFLLLFCAMQFSLPSYAAISGDTIIDHYYVGAGLGLSFLQPALNDASLVVNTSNELAYQLSGGYQFDQHWAIDLSWTELGQARVDSSSGGVAGLVGYQYYAAGALYQYPLSTTWNLFATAGAGVLKNKFQALSASRKSDASLYTGVGAIWTLANTWDLRAEYNYYASDAQMLSLKLVKRFGSAMPRRVAALEMQLQQQNAELSAVSKNLSEAVPASIKKQASCEAYYVDFKRVLFARDSIEISQQAKLALDELAMQLIKLPEGIRFEIRAHADDLGTESYNSGLSLTRAHVVRDYLATRGIALSRVDAYGYGEWLPVKGKGEANRSVNRRVELALVGVEKYVEDVSVCREPLVRIISMIH